MPEQPIRRRIGAALLRVVDERWLSIGDIGHADAQIEARPEGLAGGDVLVERLVAMSA